MLPDDPYSDGNEDDPLHEDENWRIPPPVEGLGIVPPLHHPCRCVINPSDIIYEVNGRQVAQAEYNRARRAAMNIRVGAQIQEAHQREMGEAILDSLGWGE